VKRGDNVTNAVIRGNFVDKDNATHVLEDPQRVTVNTRVQGKLAIEAPADNATVGPTFDLRGLSVPERNVTYDVTYEGRSRLLGARVTGSVQQGKVKANADGHWSVTIDTTAVRNNVLLKSIDQFIVKCSLAGGAGATAQTVQIEVKP